MISCIICKMECKPKGFDGHFRIAHLNHKPMKGKVSHRKGLTKDTSDEILKQSKLLKQFYTDGKDRRVFSPEARLKLSNLAKENGLGGYRPHPNRGERYNGIWFDSKWEVAVAKSLNENSIQWIRPKTGFVWTDKGNKYYPDFFLPDFDVYLDPKNSYLIKKDAYKISEASKRNSIKVIILTEKDLSWDRIRLLL